jgi:hypothetical protein
MQTGTVIVVNELILLHLYVLMVRLYVNEQPLVNVWMDLHIANHSSVGGAMVLKQYNRAT